MAFKIAEPPEGTIMETRDMQATPITCTYGVVQMGKGVSTFQGKTAEMISLEFSRGIQINIPASEISAEMIDRIGKLALDLVEQDIILSNTPRIIRLAEATLGQLRSPVASRLGIMNYNDETGAIVDSEGEESLRDIGVFIEKLRSAQKGYRKKIAEIMNRISALGGAQIYYATLGGPVTYEIPPKPSI